MKVAFKMKSFIEGSMLIINPNYGNSFLHLHKRSSKNRLYALLRFFFFLRLRSRPGVV